MSTTPGGSPTQPGKSPLREQVEIRVEFIVTILLDGLLVITAIAVRWAVLAALKRLTPNDTQGWAVHLLEWICDFGLVGSAIVFSAFDLAKRIVNAYREFKRPSSSQ